MPGGNLERDAQTGAAIQRTQQRTPPATPVASTQARPTHDVTQGPDAKQAVDGRYVAPPRTAGGFAGYMPDGTGIPPQYPAMPQSTPEQPLLGSIGASGTAIMSGILISEDYNPDFGWRKGVEIFDQMRRSNGTVRAIEQLLAMPLRAATWNIKPATDKPEDKRVASFVESALFHELEFTTNEGVEQHQTWDDILRHACMSMTYGFMPFELVWRQDDAGWTKWSQWMPLLPRTIWRWWVNQQTDLVGVQQRTYINYGWYYRDIPASKLVLFSNEREGNNYEGMSVFRAAYPHWFYLQQYYKIQAVGIERNAVTPPIGYLSPMATGGDRDNLFAVVQNMRVGESMGAVLQAGEKVEYPANHQHQGADVQQAIDHHMQMMAQAAVTSFLTLGASAKGAFNLAESMISMLMTLLQARAQYICDTINAGPIRQLVRYNFGEQAVYPQLTVGRLTATDLTRVANALGVLAGYIPPSNEITDFLVKMIGLPEAAHSEISATNPGGKDGAGGNGQQSDEPTQAQKETQRVGMNVLRANFNPALSESSDEASDIVTEARLLREAIGALTGGDAVEGAMQFYNANHDAKGRFAPGGAGGSGSGGGEGAKTARGGASSKGGNAKAAAEDMHARSARLQRAGGLRSEAQPDAHNGAEALRSKIEPTRSHATHPEEYERQFGAPEINLSKGLNPHEIAWQYGEHQTGAVLTRYNHEQLRAAAHEIGIQPGRSKADTVSRLTAHVTQGRYSANFGGTSGGRRSPEEIHAAKAATLKARLDKAQAAYDAHMASAPKKASERATWAAEGRRLLREIQALSLQLIEAQS